MVRRFLLASLTVIILHTSASAQSLQFQVEWIEWDEPPSDKTAAPHTGPAKSPPAFTLPACLTVSVREGEPSETTARFGNESFRVLLLASNQGENRVGVEVEIEHVKLDGESRIHAGGTFYPGRHLNRTSATVVLKRGERFVLGGGHAKLIEKNGREREWHSAFAITAIEPKNVKTDRPRVSPINTRHTRP